MKVIKFTYGPEAKPYSGLLIKSNEKHMLVEVYSAKLDAFVKRWFAHTQVGAVQS